MVMLMFIAIIANLWWLILPLFILIPLLYGFIKPQLEEAERERFRATINEKAQERLREEANAQLRIK